MTKDIRDIPYGDFCNYPTWSVHSWLNGTQIFRNTLKAIAQSTLFEFLMEDSRRNPDFHSYKRLTVQNQEIVQLRFVNKVKKFAVRDGALLGTTLIEDLFNWAIEQVNWKEIAQCTLDDLD